MCLNPVNEEFDRAYANVGLLASDVWSYQNEEVGYKKANLYLWIRFNDTEKRLIEDDSSDDLSTSTDANYTVRDVIPFSRLATYNNFEYNEGREKIYVVNDEPSQYFQNSYHLDHNDLEIWMLPEVEREFKRYTKGSQSGWSMLSPRYPSGRELVSIERITNTSPQQWLSETQWPNRLLSYYAEKLYCLKLSTDSSLFRDDLEQPVFNPEEIEMKLLEYPCPRYLIETNIDHRLHEIINSPAIRSLWANHSYPYGSYGHPLPNANGLNAEVPEFQPVAFSSKIKVEGGSFNSMNATQPPNNLHQNVHGYTVYERSLDARQHHYISIFDMNYEADIFPYSGTCYKYTVEPEAMHLEMNEEVQGNNMSELYFNLELLRSNWKDQQGCSSNNIVTLPNSEITEVAEQQLEPWMHLGGEQPYSKSQNPEKMIAFLEKWVSKMYSPRSIDFNQMSSSSGRINKIFQNIQQGYCLVQGPIPVAQPPAQRPLYSDVLMSEVNPAPTTSEIKFDELEQEALEQYSGSDTTLMISPPQTSAVPQNSQQVSEKVNPRLHSSPLPASERGHGKRPGKLLIRNPMQESDASRQSCVSGTIRENEIESKLEACFSNKQAKWMKKKKKKPEKKKKNVKHNKKKQSVEHNKKSVESEIILINQFLEILKTFKQIFFLDDWKLVQEQLTVQVTNTFERCLMMFDDCLEWFIFLMKERKSSEEFSCTKKRIDLLRATVGLSGNILRTLQQYIFLYNKIKMTIPCDPRLYFDPKTLIKQRPIMPSHLPPVPSSYNKVGLLATVPNGKYFLRLLNSVIQEERLSLSFKHEWKLPQVVDTPMNRRTYEIQINFKEWRIHLAESEMEKEEPNWSVNHKLVKIVEDYPTWYSWQWKFIDGWKLDMRDFYFSFHWCNRFNVQILEQIATSARLFVMYDWILDLIDAVVLNKHYSSCVVLWNRKIPNLVSSKMVFFRLLLQKERDWYFGDVRINQQACCRLYSGCENPCCVAWILNYDSRSMNSSSSVSLITKAHNRRVPRVTVRSTRSRCKKEETKNIKNRSKSKSSGSSEKKIIFNEIQGVNDKINLQQERYSCVIQ